MQLHTTSVSISKSFKALFNKYPKLSFASAWAGIDFDIATELISNLKKADKIIIGTHFFQTHPKFIKQTMHSRNVRFVLDANGVFHPKFYVFYENDTNWTMLLGSSNFTKGGFGNNTEILVEIDSKDADNIFFKDAMRFINNCWERSIQITDEKYKEYYELWGRKRWVRSMLSTNNEIEFSSELSSFQKLDWNLYVQELLSNESRVVSRLELLEYVNCLFLKNSDLGTFSIQDKLLIAGVSRSGRIGIYSLWAHFGSTFRQTNYRENLNNPNSPVCQSLNYIPLESEVEREDYFKFIKEFTKTYGNTSIASASRLLAMKRPDVFYSYTSENRNKFAKNFGIAPTTVNLKNYWENVVLKIRESNWYNISMPKNDLEVRISNTKAAILDAIFYEGR